MKCLPKIFAIGLLAYGVMGSVQSQDLRELPVSATQLSAMGVQFVTPKPSTTGVFLVTGSVTVPPAKQVTLSAPYSGQMSQLLVGVGDNVRVGTALGYFTSPQMADARRQYVEASSEVELAREALRRDQELFDEGIIPEVRLRVTRAKLANFEAGFKARQAELKASGLTFQESKTYDSGFGTGIIKSPISGVVVEAHTVLGQRVEVGTQLFKIADVSSLLIEVSTSADKAKQISVGDEVVIAQKNAQGKVIGVGKSVDASQASKIRVSVTKPGNIHVGDLVSLAIHTKNLAKDDSWLVPSRSLTVIKGKSVLFVTSAKGVSVLPVEVLSGDEDMSLVQGLIPQGAKVANNGIASLKALSQKDE